MDNDYDVVILGTGLVECILSGLLSVSGKKVLHLDRNPYYGGQCTSMTLSDLYQKCHGEKKCPEKYGRDRDYHIDLIPKFIMADGDLVKVLRYTQVTKYLEFQQIDGSFVYRNGKIHKVPSTEMEAFTSSVFGWFEMLRARNFFEFIKNYQQDNPSTHQGLDLEKVTMRTVYTHFGLENGVRDFIGHALALHMDDSYIDEPAIESYKNIVLYIQSMARFGKSPYVYPLYGLGELPQAFSRLSSIYGGTYMLNQQSISIVYENNKAVGVQSQGETTRCKMVIGDPSYFPDKIQKVGQVVRAICLLSNPIPNTNSESVQIIIPQGQIGRKSDIYIACLSSKHQVCPKGVYIAYVSTVVETDDPESELGPGLEFLGPVLEKFVIVSDLEEPFTDGIEDNVFISKSYDPSSHFESTYHQVRSMYKRITDTDLDEIFRKEAEINAERGVEEMPAQYAALRDEATKNAG